MMPGGKSPRRKGLNFERAVVRKLQALGIGAERIPLSGACGGSFACDINIPCQNIDRKFEAKKRADAWKDLYAWLENADGLVIARDREEPLFVLPLSLFAELALMHPKMKSAA